MSVEFLAENQVLVVFALVVGMAVSGGLLIVTSRRSAAEPES